MGKIPDLNTDNVSFLAYYEVSDTEVDGFDSESLNFPSDMDGRYDTGGTVQYENGYKFTIDDSYINSTITLRVGNDDHKWITAHIKNYNDINGGKFTGDSTDIKNFTGDDESFFKGEYDLMPWMNRDDIYDPTENTLFAAIEKSLSSTDFWNRSNLKLENAGLHNYSVNQSQSHEISIFGDGGDSESGLSFTSETQIHRAYLVGKPYYDGDKDYILSVNETEILHGFNEFGTTYAFNIKPLLANSSSNEIQIKQVEDNSKQIYDSAVSPYYCIIVWS